MATIGNDCIHDDAGGSKTLNPGAAAPALHLQTANGIGMIMFAMIQLATFALTATIGSDRIHTDSSCCKTLALQVQLIAWWRCGLLRTRMTRH